MNDITSKLAGDKLKSEIHLRHPGFTYLQYVQIIYKKQRAKTKIFKS